MKILIIGPSWIGDAVMSHSVYRLLVAQYVDQVIIDIIVPEWNYAVINRMPEINHIIATPYTHGKFELKKYYDFGRRIRGNEYQQAIVLPNSFKSALVPFFANISVRTGWRGEMRYGVLNDLRILKKKSFPLMIQRYAALTYQYNVVQHYTDLPNPLPQPYLNISRKEVDYVLQKFSLSNYESLLIGLCPGTGSGSNKSWPHYHYINLTTQLIDDGYHVVVLGSVKDYIMNYFFEQNSSLKKLKRYYDNLIGKTSLDEAIAIIAACKGIVSNDSGLMHIASALQRPVIALYGGGDLSNPNFTPPLFYKSISMFYCNKTYYCTIEQDDVIYGYRAELIRIHPDQVLVKLKTLLEES